MKTIFLIVVLTIAAVAFAACSQTTSNGNSAMNGRGMSNGSSNSMSQNSMPMNSNTDTNMPGMKHDAMQSSPNAAAAPYDLQFIDTMTRHHQGAIEMAEMALKKTSNTELKAFAQKIIDDQKKEIAQMKEWRDKWFAGKPDAMNMEMVGMKMMSGDEMKHLQGATGKDFDVDFLDMMTPHHDGAIKMAKEALTKAEHPEIKTMSNQIIKAQEGEIKQMADWKAKWSK